MFSLFGLNKIEKGKNIFIETYLKNVFAQEQKEKVEWKRDKVGKDNFFFIISPRLCMDVYVILK